MSKITFSQETIKVLEQNIYVNRVSERSITYSNEFKRLFIEEYLKGKTPRNIFIAAGFDVELLGIKRYEQAAARWIKSYRKDGIVGLRDTRKENLGRPSNSPISNEEIIRKQEEKIKLLEGQVELLKKLDMRERRLVNNCVTLTRSEAYKLIHETVSSKDYLGTVSYCCSILGVSRSGYYEYLKSSVIRDQRELADEEARDYILKAYDFKGYKKGSRSIKMTLKNEFNIIYNRKKIQRIMRKYDIICPIRKANPYRRMAKATKEHRVVPNILQRNFKQGVPGKVLLTDITYIKYGMNQMAYLSVIKDGSSNDILAHYTSSRITLDIAIETIDKLIANHKNHLHKDAFIHSDQGCHYTSPKFQSKLKESNIGQSMSRRGNCWDNAPQESFFGHMKDDVDFKSCKTLEEVIEKVDDYIEYYNYHRCQWGLKKMTPIQYRNHLLNAA